MDAGRGCRAPPRGEQAAGRGKNLGTHCGAASRSDREKLLGNGFPVLHPGRLLARLAEEHGILCNLDGRDRLVSSSYCFFSLLLQ